MNKKQRQIQAKKWIAAIIKREQSEGLIEEYGQIEGLKVYAEIIAIAEKLKNEASKAELKQ